MITLIIKSVFCKLDFLVFKTSLIIKIIVFLNKIDNIVKITTYFSLLLLSEDWN